MTFFQENWHLIAAAATLIICWFAFLRTKPTEIDSLAAFDAVVTAGHPTVLEFFNND